MLWKMSERPNDNCEFFENYENYDNYENLERSQRHPRRITKTAKIPKGTKKALWKPTWYGPIRIAKIANIMIISKTGKVSKNKLWDIRHSLRKTAYKKQGLQFGQKACISACSLCNSLFHFAYHKLQKPLGCFKFAVLFHGWNDYKK